MTHHFPGLGKTFLPCLLLALAIPLLLVPSQVQAAPDSACTEVQNTQSYTFLYGFATVNGLPVSAGSVITAYNPRGDRVGCQNIITTGQYGLMYVYGEENVSGTLIPGMRDGETVTFTIDGVSAESVPPHAWSNDWTSHQVDLSASFTTPPPAITNLEAEFNGGSLILTWSDLGGTVHHYEVWHNSTPYFNPASTSAQQVGADIPSTHIADNPISAPAITDVPGQNDYYIVVAVDTIGQVSESGKGVGLFEFPLTPGP